MKPKIFYTVLAITIAVLAILFGLWWVNGQEDTWLYATCAIIALSSFLYVSPGKKDGER